MRIRCSPVSLPVRTLNESPSEKEGKCLAPMRKAVSRCPSMKVPPKRKGNNLIRVHSFSLRSALNESPSEKEGKFAPSRSFLRKRVTLNESPSEKEGKSLILENP